MKKINEKISKRVLVFKTKLMYKSNQIQNAIANDNGLTVTTDMFIWVAIAVVVGGLILAMFMKEFPDIGHLLLDKIRKMFS